MQHLRRWAVSVPGIIFISVSLAWGNAKVETTDIGVNGKAVGCAALKGILVDANGKPYQDDHLEDRKIFAIYYGAGWCPPCRDFSPDLVKYLDATMPRHPELAAVYLSDDKQPADMLAYMQEEKMPCPAVAQKDLQQSHFLAGYTVEIIPHMVIVDRFGKVLASNDDNHGNRGDPKDTLKAMDKLLAQPTTQP